MAKQHPRTWGELGVANGGLRATSRALKFAMGWGLATAELGRPPKSLDEYAEVMEESRASAYRDQEAFRKAFPNEESPSWMNRSSGVQERYDELYATLRSRKKVIMQAQGLMFVAGASAIAV